MEDIIFSAKQVQGKKALFGKGRFALQNVDFELTSGYIMALRSGCFCGRRVQERMQGCWAASMMPLIWISLLR